ncbi:MAG: epoxyqueuosine reductase [Proteobacteria bacterium]|nr:epoxyqueuosine reductase [Pseudomonadota bacterium]
MKRSDNIEELTFRVKDLARLLGACAVGIATPETLEGGPPSTDLSYVLSGAKSAVAFAVPLDPDLVEPFLGKKDHDSFQRNNIRTNTLASGIAAEVAKYLEMKGYPSAAQTANVDYRTDTPGGALDELPPISHRYLAVRSGVGYFGRSGNVLTKHHGATVILGTLVTEASLIPTEPLPPEDNYCDECNLCNAACASGFFNPDETTTVTLGGLDFSYAKRRHHHRCDYVCGGFAGLHKSGKWSTWSPARFDIPDRDEDFAKAFPNAAAAYLKRPKTDGGFYHFLMPGNHIEFTCCFCQLVCHPDKEVRNKRFKLIKNGGVVVQNPDGSRKAVSPEEAQKWIDSLDPERRALYT